MGLKRTDEFHQDAVFIVPTNRQPRTQVAGDLGVSMSTLNKWTMADRDTNVVSQGELDLVKENERCRREIRLSRRSGTSKTEEDQERSMVRQLGGRTTMAVTELRMRLSECLRDGFRNADHNQKMGRPLQLRASACDAQYIDPR